ncbi:MAG: asparaginase [Legionellaceae bacterium]|nr:asparaginase [Legionellaceae bacterium]
MKKNILIINTGGTISSVQTPNGYSPMTGIIEQTLRSIPAFHHADMPDFHIHEYSPLLDSSNMSIKDWNRLAQDIARHYAHFDGFVIFHGTDTMAYTASALSFMLENLAKPVILTGSQIPLSRVRNDAYDNILTSLWLCAHRPVPEVCIYFNQCLLRGNRARKVSSSQFSAFDSPNFPHLAHIGTQIEIQQRLLLPTPQADFRLQCIEPYYIANFRLFPGFSTEILAALLDLPLQGLILETYGSGNAQNTDPRFLSILKNACARGLIIVNCSQCQQGFVHMDQYATGHALAEAGLISGRDMTPEAAHCKLLYLLAKSLPLTQAKERMQHSLVGELSEATGP